MGSRAFERTVLLDGEDPREVDSQVASDDSPPRAMPSGFARPRSGEWLDASATRPWVALGIALGLVCFVVTFCPFSSVDGTRGSSGLRRGHTLQLSGAAGFDPAPTAATPPYTGGTLGTVGGNEVATYSAVRPSPSPAPEFRSSYSYDNSPAPASYGGASASDAYGGAATPEAVAEAFDGSTRYSAPASSSNKYGSVGADTGYGTSDAYGGGSDATYDNSGGVYGGAGAYGGGGGYGGGGYGGGGFGGRSTAQSSTTSGRTTTQTHTTTGPRGDAPFLFCWSHMQIDSYEEKLIRFQLVRRASIFACNDYAVISTKKKSIGQINGSDVFTWFNPANAVGMGRYGVDGATTDSFLNTETFLQAWDTLLGSGHLWPFDFVVKVDPDAVFFPDRLRAHVKDVVGQPVYYANCGKFGGRPMLYGSIEVFSVQALGAYQDRREECKRLPWHGWGEDYYMQHCMDMMGIRMMTDFDQVGDNRCIGAPCSDWHKVAFHDFKDPGAWENCFKTAIAR